MEDYYLNDDAYDEAVPSITSCYTSDVHPSVVERYFTTFYYPKQSANGDNEDHLVLYHSNRLCLIGLAKSHVAFTKGISSINYKIGNCDRSTTQVKGKHKKGGLNLQPTTAVALITCKDGSEYKVVSGIYGKLLEVNDRLEGESLHKLNIPGTGYIAIVLCKPENADKVKDSLVPADKYVVS